MPCRRSAVGWCRYQWQRWQLMWALLPGEGGLAGLASCDFPHHQEATLARRWKQMLNFWIYHWESPILEERIVSEGQQFKPIIIWHSFQGDGLECLLFAPSCWYCWYALVSKGCWCPCCKAEEKDLWYHQRFRGYWSHREEVKKQHSVEVSVVNSSFLTVLESNTNSLHHFLQTG